MARVRRVLDGPKVGHAGTLDPDATGVLVICVGKATKISSFLMESDKIYVGTGRLGARTDTQDASGEVLEERPVECGAAELSEASARFIGPIEQIPPMYSAVKVGGKKLYRLARKGVEIERPARPVTIRSFDLGRIELPDFDFSVECTKGTYVRTLMHDLGEALGCGGHLASLSRSKQGGFSLENALPWEALNGADAVRRIEEAAVTPEEALEFLPRWRVPAAAPPLRVGGLITVKAGEETDGDEGLRRLVVAGGRVGGIGKLGPEGLRVLYLFPVRSGSSSGFGRKARGS